MRKLQQTARTFGTSMSVVLSTFTSLSVNSRALSLKTGCVRPVGILSLKTSVHTRIHGALDFETEVHITQYDRASI
jgi:hypothetical protein